LVCALAWGARGREFKSHRPDHSNSIENIGDNSVQANIGNAPSWARETILTQETAESDTAKVRFPKRIKYRGRTLAVIYEPCKGRDSYRVAWHVAGRRRMASFPSYSLAKGHADALVRDLAKGSQATALHPAQARDALAALERLGDLYRATGKHVSLLAVASEYAEAAKKLNGRSLGEAVDGFLSNVATVKRVDLNAAVEQFIESRKSRTISTNGKRPQLSPGWHYNVSMWLREFAKALPGHAVCDLTREHLAVYINAHNGVSPRTRNCRRNSVRMFLKWAVERDYLPANHKLLVADGMAKEVEDTGEIQFHTPKELRMMLDFTRQRAEYRPLLPVIALGGLAGLRLQEIARLDWQDVFRVPKHIEIAATKAKTRQRRLVQIVPALAVWLRDYCGNDGPVWAGTDERANTLDNFHHLFGKMLDELGIPAKRNGLRHAFCSYHFALHANENLTAQQAGNSPTMIHAHYKGLATKAEAEKWFKVRPAKIAKRVSKITTRIEA
jgi:integrase